jgi:hypothetical protein
VTRTPLWFASEAGLGDSRKGRRWKLDYFSRNGMNLIGLLLLLVTVSAVYTLWDVAIKRWFG